MSNTEAVRRYKERNLERVKEKDRRASARWREENPGYMRDYMLKYKFGLTREEHKNMYSGICDGCKEPVEYEVLVTDHDKGCCPDVRTCGLCIRGLLHSNCNTAIGLCNDSPTKLRALADYLEEYYGK